MQKLSESRRTTGVVNALPDDVLLFIFDHYRQSTVGAHSSWCQIWCTLAHVCKRWKELILASSRRLDVQLRCTFGTYAEDLIAYSPALPLVLDYQSRHDEKWTYADMDSVIVALNQLHRAREIALSAPASMLAKLTAAMADVTAPILERLELESQTTELSLPRQFLDVLAPPHLRLLRLSGCVLQAWHPLLSSTTSLEHLALHRIPVSTAEFVAAPEGLVSCVRSMPRLRTLSISFVSAAAPHSSPVIDNRLLSPHQTTPPTPSRTSDTDRVELPALEELAYQGPPTYIDAFLAAFSGAPCMRRLRLNLFDKPKATFSIPHVAKFIYSRASADLPKPAPSLALVEFYESSAWLTLFPPTSPRDRTMPRQNQYDNAHDDDHDGSNSIQNEISIRVSCELLEGQLSALASVCSALARHTLSSVTELMLGFYAHELPTPSTDSAQQRQRQLPHDAAQTLWLALLLPFQSIRTLRVDTALGAEIARALTTGVENGGLAQEHGESESDSERLELLPALCAVEPLYQVVSAPGLFSSTHAALLKLAERNRRFAAGRHVVDTH